MPDDEDCEAATLVVLDVTPVLVASEVAVLYLLVFASDVVAVAVADSVSVEADD